MAPRRKQVDCLLERAGVAPLGKLGPVGLGARSYIHFERLPLGGKVVREAARICAARQARFLDLEALVEARGLVENGDTPGDVAAPLRRQLKRSRAEVLAARAKRRAARAARK